MPDLLAKDKSIQYITNLIVKRWKQVAIADFWEGDNSAVGLRAENKIIYISTWNFRFLPIDAMKYYVVFEYFADKGLDNKVSEKEYQEISEEQLLLEISLLLHQK